MKIEELLRRGETPRERMDTMGTHRRNPVEKKAVVSLPRLVPRLKEKAIELLLQSAAFTSVAITLGIVGVLAYESFHFFQQVSVVDFLTDRQWTLFADAYGILSLVSNARHDDCGLTRGDSMGSWSPSI